MSHDDPKDRSDEVPTPEAADKQPLGFEQEVAPADPSLAGRRLFLKLALFGAAATMLPEAVRAAISQSPVDLPYKNTLEFKDQPGTLTNPEGKEGYYRVSGSGDFYIDAAGTIFLSNVKATGIFHSGVLNVGTISVVQPTASMAGKYSDTQVDASSTVLYSDKDVKQQPATLRVGGSLYKGGADLAMGVEFRSSFDPGDSYIGVSWTKATC